MRSVPELKPFWYTTPLWFLVNVMIPELPESTGTPIYPADRVPTTLF